MPHQNPRVQVAAVVAAVEAKLASIPGIPESVPATIILADGAPLNAPHFEVIRSSREKLGGGKGEAERRARTFLQFVCLAREPQTSFAPKRLAALA